MAHAPQPLASERHFVLAWDTYGVSIERHLASRLMSHDAIAATVICHFKKPSSHNDRKQKFRKNFK
jgi:hypothetical protein